MLELKDAAEGLLTVEIKDATLVLYFEDEDLFLSKATRLPFVPSSGDVICETAKDLNMSVMHTSWEIDSNDIEVHLEPSEDNTPDAYRKRGLQ